MQQLLDLQQSWTFEDLQQLPEDVDWRRYEIVDGALVVSPSARSLHELLIVSLRDQIRDATARGYSVIGSMGIDLDDSYRVPDLVVARTQVLLADVARLRPVDVLLAVEIVSPSSRTTDRITKPAQYAAAGIPAYWRVETEPDVTLTAYRLEPGADSYTELGTWGPGQSAELEHPFPVTVAIDELSPRA